tara:strand:- start:266 stop:835 length:570 start_codon:yes stop_codon:yes gene_type:complete
MEIAIAIILLLLFFASIFTIWFKDSREIKENSTGVCLDFEEARRTQMRRVSAGFMSRLGYYDPMLDDEYDQSIFYIVADAQELMQYGEFIDLWREYEKQLVVNFRKITAAGKARRAMSKLVIECGQNHHELNLTAIPYQEVVDNYLLHFLPVSIIKYELEFFAREDHEIPTFIRFWVNKYEKDIMLLTC